MPARRPAAAGPQPRPERSAARALLPKDLLPEDQAPRDLPITAADKVRIRQDPVPTAPGGRAADPALRVGRLLDVHTGRWLPDREIVVKQARVARSGPAGGWTGDAAAHLDRGRLDAAPGSVASRAADPREPDLHALAPGAGRARAAMSPWGFVNAATGGGTSGASY